MYHNTARHKVFKPCPNGGVRCGKSSACFPKGTICAKDRDSIDKESKKIIVDNDYKPKPIFPGSENEKRKPAVREDTGLEETSSPLAVRSFPWKYVVAGSVIVGLGASGALYYKHQQTKQLKPTPFDSPELKRSLKEVIPYKDLPTEELPKGDIHRNINGKLIQHKKARDWATEALKDPDTVILDLETTALMQGLDPYTPEAYRKVRNNVPKIIELGMVTPANMEEVNVRMNPQVKISKASKEITGISEDDVKGKPPFKEIYPQLSQMLSGKRVLAFNSRFDTQVIDALCHENNLPLIPFKNRPTEAGYMDNGADVMHQYALYMGKNVRASMTKGTYDVKKGLGYASLPKLPGVKAHQASSDCWSTYDVLRHMASGAEPRDMKLEEKKAWVKLTDGFADLQSVKYNR